MLGRRTTSVACAVLLVSAVAACGQSTDPAAPQQERSLSRAEVTQAAAAMRRTVMKSGSGTFDQRVFTEFPGFFLEKSSDVKWALGPNRWEMGLELRGSDDGSENLLAGGRLTFLVVDDVMYVTSSEWTGATAGKWMSFSQQRLEALTGFDVPMSSTQAPPPAVLGLMSFRGVSGAETSEGLELTGRVPFPVFSQLVGLTARVTTQVPNLREVVPSRDVQVTLDSAGRPLTLTIGRGEIPALPTGDPAAEDVVPLLVEATETTVAYADWGVDVEITAPDPEDTIRGQ